MDDKNDEYYHIITSVCIRLLLGQYGINPDSVFYPDNYFYRDVLKQY